MRFFLIKNKKNESPKEKWAQRTYDLLNALKTKPGISLGVYVAQFYDSFVDEDLQSTLLVKLEKLVEKYNIEVVSSNRENTLLKIQEGVKSLTKQDIEQLEFFYMFTPFLDSFPGFIHKGKREVKILGGKLLSFDLPRSVVIFGPQAKKYEGCFILLKLHGGESMIGEGSYGRVTKSVNWDTGKTMAFKSLLEQEVSNMELQLVDVLINSKFAEIGYPIHYSGFQVRRLGIFNVQFYQNLDNLMKQNKISEEKRQEMLFDRKRKYKMKDEQKKVGFIMEYIPKSLGNSRKMEHGSKIKLLLSLCLALQQFHHLGYVHNDVRIDNFLIKDDNQVILIDFSLAIKIGELFSVYEPLIISSPETKLAIKMKKSIVSSEKNDIFMLGWLIMDFLFDETDFDDPYLEYVQLTTFDEQDYKPIFDNLVETLKTKFPELLNSIRSCIMFNPQDRIELQDLIEQINKLV